MVKFEVKPRQFSIGSVQALLGHQRAVFKLQFDHTCKQYQERVKQTVIFMTYENQIYVYDNLFKIRNFLFNYALIPTLLCSK